VHRDRSVRGKEGNKVTQGGEREGSKLRKRVGFRCASPGSFRCAKAFVVQSEVGENREEKLTKRKASNCEKTSLYNDEGRTTSAGITRGIKGERVG
jgi:hypothetical protein